MTSPSKPFVGGLPEKLNVSNPKPIKPVSMKSTGVVVIDYFKPIFKGIDTGLKKIETR